MCARTRGCIKKGLIQYDLLLGRVVAVERVHLLHINMLCACSPCTSEGAFKPRCCIKAWWPAHAATCTYLEILHGQTRQLQRRNSLAQSSFSLLPLFLLVLLQHLRCHFQHLGLDWIKGGIKEMAVNYYQLYWKWWTTYLKCQSARCRDLRLFLQEESFKKC